MNACSVKSPRVGVGVEVGVRARVGVRVRVKVRPNLPEGLSW